MKKKALNSININEIYAHTPVGNKWHLLYDHLFGVAKAAKEMASSFGKGSQAFWLGIMHDIGKISPAFQGYLRKIFNGEASSCEPHAIWGAAYMYLLLAGNMNLSDGWEQYCLPIMGHHAGLPDIGIGALRIESFIKENKDAIKLMGGYLKGLLVDNKAIADEVPKVEIETNPPYVREHTTRMLYSVLVDADYLDTDSHFNRDKQCLRKSWPELDSLSGIFTRQYRAYINQLKSSSCDDVIRIRDNVYTQCIEKAEDAPGIFTLTAPTGSGKTLGYLAFALNHAVKHKKSRIIVVLPYTSIIDQTARTIRRILGSNAVLEHHSSFDVSIIDDGALVDKYMLASENWDAPIIVTTTVQFFESLFSNKPSKVRKIHNIANSVVVLDEVQALPPEMLGPTLDMVRSLANHYGVSFLLSTATQPAFEMIDGQSVFTSLSGREIIPDYNTLFKKMRRVIYEIYPGNITWDELLRSIHGLDQVMVVFNTRAHATKLFSMLEQDDGTFHLSSMLCAKHRKAILETVKQRLEDGLRVRLITTQVVEAGVDLDFPEVWRAIGPLDRIVQAAGRCNRNGRLACGKVIIFEPEEAGTPGGPYKIGVEKSKMILKQHDAEDLHNPEIYREYFSRLYQSVNLDVEHVQLYRRDINYPEVAKKYKLIRENTAMVVVPYRDSAERLQQFQAFPSRETWYGLQPFVVNVREKDILSYSAKGYARMITGNLYEWFGPYDENLGLTDLYFDPADLVI
ncbi:MAG: CRISPR-associated helicase Cas3' [Actinobacteria bacterium]|nr:CRISPR-associated helicase Cas3' [Actinomycetota bacterium]